MATTATRREEFLGSTCRRGSGRCLSSTKLWQMSSHLFLCHCSKWVTLWCLNQPMWPGGWNTLGVLSQLLGWPWQACKPCNCPPSRLKKEPRDSNKGLNGLTDRGSYKSETKGPGATRSPWLADSRQDMAAVFATRGRRRPPFIGGIDVRLAHRLPVLGAGGEWINRTRSLFSNSSWFDVKTPGPREHKGRCVDGSTHSPYSGDSILVFLYRIIRSPFSAHMEHRGTDFILWLQGWTCDPHAQTDLSRVWELIQGWISDFVQASQSQPWDFSVVVGIVFFFFKSLSFPRSCMIGYK